MAIFRNEPEEFERLDWQLLQNGAVTLYFRSEVLLADLEWLKRHEYRVDSFECSMWVGEDEMHEALSCGFEFPTYYGRNLNALSDCIGDIDISEQGGRVVVLNQYDLFAERFPDLAWTVLDIMETNSRTHLLFARRLIVLVQSNDPEISFEPIGGRPVMWNRREWLNTSRTSR